MEEMQPVLADEPIDDTLQSDLDAEGSAAPASNDELPVMTALAASNVATDGSQHRYASFHRRRFLAFSQDVIVVATVLMADATVLLHPLRRRRHKLRLKLPPSRRHSMVLLLPLQVAGEETVW